MAVSPNGSRVFVANWVEGKIIELDPNTLTPVGQPIAVAGGGDDMVFSPDGTRLYVAHDGANAALSIIDTGSRTVIGTLRPPPTQLAWRSVPTAARFTLRMGITTGYR